MPPPRCSRLPSSSEVRAQAGSARPSPSGLTRSREQRTDADFSLVDLASFELPLLDEPIPAAAGAYSNPHTKRWSAAIASFDGYVFVTPEYNHGTSGALKNAIDFLYNEWSDKAAGFIGYGYAMGARAIENLRLVMASLQVATVRPQVGLSLVADFEGGTVFQTDGSTRKEPERPARFTWSRGAAR